MSCTDSVRALNVAVILCTSAYPAAWFHGAFSTWYVVSKPTSKLLNSTYFKIKSELLTKL